MRHLQPDALQRAGWWIGIVTLTLAVSAGGGLAAALGHDANPEDDADVVWETPSTSSVDSMPLGNGDIGLNLWVAENGDLLAYLSKTDAWDAQANLLKLGCLRVKLTPNPFRHGTPFHQHLHLATATIELAAGPTHQPTLGPTKRLAGRSPSRSVVGGRASREPPTGSPDGFMGSIRGESVVGSPNEEVRLRVWVDANAPVIRMELAASKPVAIEVSVETPWRTGDVYRAGEKDRIVWYRRNTTSIWPAVMRAQGLAEWAASAKDPLLNRTFGGLIKGQGFANAGPARLRAGPTTKASWAIHVLTAQTETPEDWLEQLQATAARTEARRPRRARAAHEAWWRAFWRRSWIRIETRRDGDRPGAAADPGRRVAQQYARQRFLNACGGRGAYPIKFNGSIFNAERIKTGNPAIDNDATMYNPSHPYGHKFDPATPDPDYRLYGGYYWFQNTRLIYWPMLASGDGDLLQPFFRLYRNLLPLCQARTAIYTGHQGAYYPECIYFFGAVWNGTFNPANKGKPAAFIGGPYLTYHWNGQLELLAMMLDYYRQTEDRSLLQDTILPVADAVFLFYEQQYPRDDRGQRRLYPAQALETWWDVVNPLPDVAGLRWDLGELLALPEPLLGARRRQAWQQLSAALPELPIGENSPALRAARAKVTLAELASQPPADKTGACRMLLPGEKFAKHMNCEYPELYAVFPYRFYGVNRPGLELARVTMAQRDRNGWTWCWDQDPIFAACLGQAAEAQALVEQRFLGPAFRFPVLYHTPVDWYPDEDHAGVAMTALQSMLLQTVGDKILLFPAWPKEWDVDFKLHAPRRTTVTAVLRHGRLEKLQVTPAARQKDVQVLLATEP